MSTKSAYNLLIITLFVGLTKCSPIEPDPTFQCPQPDGHYRNVHNSSQYYLCRNSDPFLMSCPLNQVFDGVQRCIDDDRPVIRTCPSGTYYDDRIGRCTDPTPPPLPPTVGHLHHRHPTACPEPSAFAHPSNQSEYYECVAGVYVLKTCPYGLYFDELAMECFRFGNQFHCPKYDGVFSDPENITRYYKCRQNRPELRYCPPSYTFDGHQCHQHYRCPSTDGHFASPHSIHEYYHCRNGVPTLQTCPHDYRFDVSYSQCVEIRPVVVDRRRTISRMRIISGRIEFDDNGVRVVDVWDTAIHQWKRTYNGQPYEASGGVYVPANGAPDTRGLLYNTYNN